MTVGLRIMLHSGLCLFPGQKKGEISSGNFLAAELELFIDEKKALASTAQPTSTTPLEPVL
jgi:hypothetical protein